MFDDVSLKHWLRSNGHFSGKGMKLVNLALCGLSEQSSERKDVRRRISRRLLLPPGSSSLLYFARRAISLNGKVYSDGFVRIFRFSIPVFYLLESRFSPIFERSRFRRSRAKTGSKRKPAGRPQRRLLTSRQALLILLRFLASGPHNDDLSLLSGTLPNVLSETMKHALHTLVVVLRRWGASRMCFPRSDLEATKLSWRAKRYLYLRHNVEVPGHFIGALDGSAIARERPEDDAWQQTNHNSKIGDAMKVLLVCLFDGTYGGAILNFIGTGHDSKLCCWLSVSHEMRHLNPAFMVSFFFLFCLIFKV
jgi:hypothetical protein